MPSEILNVGTVRFQASFKTRLSVCQRASINCIEVLNYIQVHNNRTQLKNKKSEQHKFSTSQVLNNRKKFSTWQPVHNNRTKKKKNRTRQLNNSQNRALMAVAGGNRWWLMRVRKTETEREKERSAAEGEKSEKKKNTNTIWFNF